VLGRAPAAAAVGEEVPVGEVVVEGSRCMLVVVGWGHWEAPWW
jgi:hypothetical protein